MEIICEQHSRAIIVCDLFKKSFPQLPHLKKHMLCVHNTDKPYYCEKCEGFYKVCQFFFKTCQIFLQTLSYQVKSEYEEHAAREHPEDLPEDLTPEPVAKTGADLNSMQVQ